MHHFTPKFNENQGWIPPMITNITASEVNLPHSVSSWDKTGKRHHFLSWMRFNSRFNMIVSCSLLASAVKLSLAEHVITCEYTSQNHKTKLSCKIISPCGLGPSATGLLYCPEGWRSAGRSTTCTCTVMVFQMNYNSWSKKVFQRTFLAHWSDFRGVFLQQTKWQRC